MRTQEKFIRVEQTYKICQAYRETGEGFPGRRYDMGTYLPNTKKVQQEMLQEIGAGRFGGVWAPRPVVVRL